MRRRRVLIALGLLALAAVLAVVVAVPSWREQARQRLARGRALLQHRDEVKGDMRLDEVQAVLGLPDRVEATGGGGQVAVWSGDTETGRVEIEVYFSREGGVYRWVTGVSYLSIVDRMRQWLARAAPWSF